VPGAAAGWCDLLAGHGRMPVHAVLAPAIRLAEEGFPVAPIIAHYWWASSQAGVLNSPGGREFTLDGRAPRAGEIVRLPGLARTLRAIAEGGKEAFYRGPIAYKIAAAVQARGGVLTEADLAGHESTWEEPISTSYRGVRLWECRPNGQGLAALLALNFLEGFDLQGLAPLGVERLHLMIECLRLAFADTQAHVADPAFHPGYDELIGRLASKAYAAGRRTLIRRDRATLDTPPGLYPQSDTVYVSVVDGAGNACSFINSLYMGFGTGIVPEGTGICLQNRGYLFSLDPAHPNALAPGKRPYHTIIPALATREGDGSLYACLGMVGGFMQPQGHVQMLVNLVDDRLDPQAALDRPRFCVEGARVDGALALEEGLPAETAGGLRALGHNVSILGGYDRAAFGRGQIILRDADSGVLWGGCDPRSDGQAAGF
jgi:gamma-glutamyltranspeptidase/glutathione hydrolase